MDKITALVTESAELTPGIRSLTVRLPESTDWDVRPGQFAGLYPADGSMLLMRPISVCRWDPARRELRFVYRPAGAGTRSFTALREGDTIDLLGPLGNGYDTEALAGRHVLLLGGGIGVPPMLELAAALRNAGAETQVTAALGYRTDELFLAEDFRETGAEVLIATEDGTAGTKGTVLDAVREAGIRPDAVCACGPMPMLRAVKRYAEELGIDAWLSLEERMACGVGACLGCVVKTRETDAHSHVKNARICTEGPVFAAREVEIG